MEYDLNNAKQEAAAESENASDLEGGNSRPADNAKVPPEILDALIGNFSHPADFTSSIVLIGSNCDGNTLLKTKIDEEEYSRNFACKVLAEITYREIGMNFEYSIQIATQVFEEMSHSCFSKVLTDESDLDDAASEKEKALDKNFQKDVYGLPKYMITNRIMLDTGIISPFTDTLSFSSQLSLVQHSNTWATNARDIKLRKI